MQNSPVIELNYFLHRISSVREKERQKSICRSIAEKYVEVRSAFCDRKLPAAEFWRAIIAIRLAATRYRLGEIGIIPIDEIEIDYNRIVQFAEDAIEEI